VAGKESEFDPMMGLSDAQPLQIEAEILEVDSDLDPPQKSS
jgi:hypothetical protein